MSTPNEGKPTKDELLPWLTEIDKRATASTAQRHYDDAEAHLEFAQVADEAGLFAKRDAHLLFAQVHATLALYRPTGEQP